MDLMTSVNEPVELNQISTMTADKPDDIFILCASDEDRCKGAVSRLAPEYRTGCFFLIRYIDPNPEREKNIEEIKKMLVGKGHLIEFPIDQDKPLIGINSLLGELYRYIPNINQPRISFDFTTLMKWNLLLILRGLEMKHLAKSIRYLYTEPVRYQTEVIKPLSYGVKEDFAIPTFSGSYDFSKEPLLIILLGYEGDRALSLFEKVEPAECLLFIADPPYNDEWRGITEKMNEAIINLAGEDKKKPLEARDPLVVAEQLHSVLSSNEYSKYNHMIAPLGTKPQTVGLHLYMQTNPLNTILLYNRPLRHNQPFYSEGIGKTWHLPFSKLPNESTS
jgi:hypothetical protein